MQKVPETRINMPNVLPIGDGHQEPAETTDGTTAWNGWLLSSLKMGCDSFMGAMTSLFDTYLPTMIDRSICAYDQSRTTSIEEMREEEEWETNCEIDRHNKVRDHQPKHRGTLKAFLSQYLLPHVPMQKTHKAYADIEVVSKMIAQQIISHSDLFTVFRIKGDSPIDLDALVNAIANGARGTKDLMAVVDSLNPDRHA